MAEEIILTISVKKGSKAIPHIDELLDYIQADPDLAEKLLDMAASEGIIEVPGHADAVRYVAEKYGTKRDEAKAQVVDMLTRPFKQQDD